MPRCLTLKPVFFLIALLSATGLLPTATATASSQVWKAGNGQWDVAGNWSTGTLPQAGDVVSLTYRGTVDRTVTYYNTTNPTDVFYSLTIDAWDTGTISLDMPYDHSINTGNCYVGNSGRGIMTQSAGTNATGSLYVGYGAGSVASYTMTGGMASSTTHVVGYSGTGTMNILNGAHASTGRIDIGQKTGSNGTANVSGAGSTWTNSGQSWFGGSGTGALNVTSGGVVSDTNGYVGNIDGKGTVTVDGDGSKWINSGVVNIGFWGAGFMYVQNGGQVSNKDGFIGTSGTSSGMVVVEGNGSLWSNTGYLFMAAGNTTGSLTIRNGGQVTAGQRIQLSSAAATVNLQSGGRLTVGSILNSAGGTINWTGGTLDITGADGLTIGAGGPLGSSLTLDAGKELNVTKTTTLGAGSSLNLSGGNLTTESFVNSGGTGSLTVQSGGDMTVTNNLANSGVLTVNEATLSAGTITNTGTIRGRGDISGTITSNAGGIVAPGESPGILEVDNIIFGNASTLAIELGGLARGTQYDVLAASGTVTLQSGITLALTLINGFVPQRGDEFDILDFAGLSGQFSTRSLPDLGGGLSWDTSDLYTSGTITVAPEPATLALAALGAAALLARRRR